MIPTKRKVSLQNHSIRSVRCSLWFIFIFLAVIVNRSADIVHAFQSMDNTILKTNTIIRCRHLRSKALLLPRKKSSQWQSSFSWNNKRRKHSTEIYGVKNTNDPYSRELRLREEAESPFRKVRFLVYGALAAGAATSLAVSIARIAAGLAGINADLLNESLENSIVDSLGIIALYFLWKRDSEEQENRLKQAARGADYAKLMVRGSQELLLGEGDTKSSASSESTTVSRPLSSLRRGRGKEKRVVIAAAGKDTIRKLLEEMAEMSLNASLNKNDLVIVPVTLPQCTAPLGIEKRIINKVSSCIALPAGGDWVSVMNDESETAKNQGIDVLSEGFCIILKENGIVGQRAKGIKLERMVDAAMERKTIGIDVANI